MQIQRCHHHHHPPPASSSSTNGRMRLHCCFLHLLCCIAVICAFLNFHCNKQKIVGVVATVAIAFSIATARVIVKAVTIAIAVAGVKLIFESFKAILPFRNLAMTRRCYKCNSETVRKIRTSRVLCVCYRLEFVLSAKK